MFVLLGNGWVVGYGCGFFLFGFNVGGDRGRGTNEGKCCLPFVDELLYQVAVDGGDIGIALDM